MPTVNFGDLSFLYWQVTHAIDEGRDPSYQEMRDALDIRDVTNFLNQYSEVDLSLYGSDPRCTLDELDTVLENWSAADPSDLSLSRNTNGLRYLAGVIVNLLQNGDWQDNQGQSIEATELKMNI